MDLYTVVWFRKYRCDFIPRFAVYLRQLRCSLTRALSVVVPINRQKLQLSRRILPRVRGRCINVSISQSMPQTLASVANLFHKQELDTGPRWLRKVTWEEPVGQSHSQSPQHQRTAFHKETSYYNYLQIYNSDFTHIQITTQRIPGRLQR